MLKYQIWFGSKKVVYN